MVGDWLPLVDEHALCFPFVMGFWRYFAKLLDSFTKAAAVRRFSFLRAVQVASRAIETAALATILDG